MDRRIIYPGAIPLETDLLGADKWALEGLADLAAVVLGNAIPAVNGLTVGPNSPLALSVVVQPGSIYAPLALDGTAYSTMGTDSHVVMQQGMLRDAQVLAITPPGTVGQSRVYLVQAACQVVDADPTVLPYYNAADPTVALTGPGNSGTPQNTRRAVQAVINLKAGTPATTGTQVAPSVDAGFVALAAVTVANGATTIISGNIVATAGLRRAKTALPDISDLKGEQVFTSSGTFTVPDGVTKIRARVWGGGGGSGGTNVGAATGGGGGGGYTEKIVITTPGATFAVTVGAAGAAAGAGGTSSFASECSATGGAGSAGTASGITAGGAGGIGTGGTFNLTGQAGASGGSFTDNHPGIGGATYQFSGSYANGSASGLYGAGAGGASGGSAGAAGRPGLVIVEW